MSQFPSPNSPASPSEAKSALIALFEAFPADRGEGTAAVATYLIAIDGYSLKAIQGAVKRIIRGEVSEIDRRFLPSPAQLGNVCAYLEKLYAPVERKLALPSPDEIPADTDTAAWERRRQIAEQAKARFAPPASPMLKPMTEADLEVFAAAERERLRKGNFTLSAAARATFDKDHLDRVARPSPDEDFDRWSSLSAPTLSPSTDKDIAA